MQRVTVRFYEELNDFLESKRRKVRSEITFELPRSVKDLIESLGVPHVEVDLILVNGESCRFDRIVSNGDDVSVYPVFESLNIGGVGRLRPRPLRVTRFVLDIHLGALTRRIRLVGFDAKDSIVDDGELALCSSREERILLTRDLGLLKRGIVTRGLAIRASDPDEQLFELLDRLNLYDQVAPFSRCIACNGLLERVVQTSAGHSPAQIIGKGVPEGILSWCTVRSFLLEGISLCSKPSVESSNEKSEELARLRQQDSTPDRTCERKPISVLKISTHRKPGGETRDCYTVILE